jgi:hypothetical protein
LFVGIGFACLSYGLSARGYWPLVTLASVPSINAAISCQWTPIITAGALLPWLAWLAAAKPTTGVVVSGAFLPFRRLGLNLIIGAAFVVVSFALWPRWFGEWLDALRGARHFVPLVLRPGGPLLLLSMLRWRRPRARLLVLSALVPQTGAAYDALPLVLVPTDRLDALIFGLLSFVTLLLVVPTPGTGEGFVRAASHNQTVYMFLLYFPALVAVLRDSRGKRVSKAS